MSRYALNIWQPVGGTPDPETLAGIMAGLETLNRDLRAAGEWVFDGGYHQPEASTVVRADGLITDGPYVEGKEFVGGFWVIEVPDLDRALEWGRRAAAATTLPIEVRPFAG